MTRTTPSNSPHLSRCRVTLIGLGFGLTALLGAPAIGQTPTPASQAASTADASGQTRLTVNKSRVITTTFPFKRINVAQPDIADVNVLSPTTLLLTAKKPGSTQLILWDENNKSQVIDVTVEADLALLREQVDQMFPNSKIEVAAVNGAIALRGRVSDAQTAKQVATLAAPFAPKVLNFLEIGGGRQVMLQVRFAEVSRQAMSQLGVNLGYSDGSSFAGSNIGGVSPLGIQDGTSLLANSPTAAVTLFGRGVVGQTALTGFISALRQNNLMRTLAEPNLITMSGQEASFLAGGEFPVPVVQNAGTGAGDSAITIEYREFGVKLNFTPIVLGDGRIRLKCAPEVSDVDFTNAVRSGGFLIPGLSKRRVNTTVELAEGQTFAIAGLMNNQVVASKEVTPLLGQIPVIGALFRSVRYQHKETELVILVTPHLVSAMNPDQLRDAGSLPGEHWRNPDEAQLFLFGDLGGEKTDTGRIPPDAASTQAPAQFRGQHGFVPAASTIQEAETGR